MGNIVLNVLMIDYVCNVYKVIITNKEYVVYVPKDAMVATLPNNV